ncbi:uncharacterized protein LOC131952920 [Physella acuta]|uniref:uncharacterized protein LOC131952920 n=1 Tax=Physella acuta TaxID=109671 RepID=UPI0027DD0A5A|nr:uncharacterized protein LOC131952920 [Physella acuta]
MSERMAICKKKRRQSHKSSLIARWIVAMTTVLEKPSLAFTIFLIGVIVSIGAVFEVLFFHNYCLGFPVQKYDGDGRYLFLAEVLAAVWLDIYVVYAIKKMLRALKKDLSREFVKQEEDGNETNQDGGGVDEQAHDEVKNLKNILELDVLIRRYAWQMLLKRQDLLSRQFLEVEDEVYTCQVDWTALTFEHKVIKFSPNVKDGTVIESQRGEMQTGSKWVTLWSCDFDNKAECKQSHAFSGARDTITWVDVDLEQCYTVNKEPCVQLNLPQNARIGKENTLVLNKVKGQVHKEVLTWEVKSQVEVEPSSRAHAQLLVRQECSAFDFEIRTTLSNPKGVVPIRFVRQRDKKVVCALNIKNLADVFLLAEEGGVLKPEEKACVELVVEKWLDKDGVEHSTSHPQIITRGTCVCLSWTDQRVDIKTSQISLDDYISDGDVSDNKSAGNLMNQDANGGSYFS